MSEVWPVGLESVRAAVLAVIGEVVEIERLTGGVQGGAWRLRASEHAQAVLKARPWAHELHLEQMQTSGRVTDRLLEVGYPTARWLATGASDVLVWQLLEYVDADHARVFDDDIIDELLCVVELQAGLGREGSDWSAYARRVLAGEEAAFEHVVGFSPEVASLVERLRDVSRRASSSSLPSDDIVHGDLNPSNVLVRDGRIVAVIDTGSAGRGSRAIDLATIVWGTPMGSSAEGTALARLSTVADQAGAVVALALHIWHMLEFPIRHQRRDIVPGVVVRAHHVLDQLADA